MTNDPSMFLLANDAPHGAWADYARRGAEIMATLPLTVPTNRERIAP